jgi:hypothetical protein
MECRASGNAAAVTNETKQAKGSGRIVAMEHQLGPKRYQIRLTLDCGHTATIYNASREPKLGDDQICLACTVQVLKGPRP